MSACLTLNNGGSVYAGYTVVETLTPLLLLIRTSPQTRSGIPLAEHESMLSGVNCINLYGGRYRYTKDLKQRDSLLSLRYLPALSSG
jgi:hypothetical protein